MAFDRVYADELERLRTLGREYSEENPSIAPFLSSTSGDPDIERLLQGFAFLSAMVRQKMDDEVPELIHDISSLIGPELTKPLPSITVLKLEPLGKLEGGLKVPAQTPFASHPIEGTTCEFTTAWPVTVQPVKIENVRYEPTSEGTRLFLDFSLVGLTLGQWNGKNISMFLSGGIVEGSSWLRGFRHKLISCRVFDSELKDFAVDIVASFPGLDPNLSLFPEDRSVASHVRWVREFLGFPERAFFMELEGFSAWDKSPIAKNFTVEFELAVGYQELPKPSTSQFTPNAVPASNIFECYAEPILINHLKESYKILPAGFTPRHAEVHEVLTVKGRRQGDSSDRAYVPFTDFLSESKIGRYQIVFGEGIRFNSLDHYIRLPITELPQLDQPETLSIRLRCTNGRLPEKLRLGDINKRTVDSPERLTVSNVMVPTASTRPSLGSDSMWRVVSHARLNLQAFSHVDTLKEFLVLYSPEGGDPARLSAVKRRIQGIDELTVQAVTEMHQGALIRGHLYILKMNRDFFAGSGDLILMGEMLVHFFAGVVPLNSFIRLIVVDAVSGEQVEWPKLLAPGLNL